MGNTCSRSNNGYNNSKQHNSNFNLDNNDSKQNDSNFSLDIWNGNAKTLENIILDYSFEPKRMEAPQTKFWTSSLKQEILALAYHAAPLDQVESYIKKAYAKKEKHLCDTLVEAAAEAIKNGDVTLTHNINGKIIVIAEGMAEKLMQLHDELYPKDLTCIKKLRSNIIIEDAKERKSREDANVIAINQIFDAIRVNNLHMNASIENFKEFVKSTTPFNQIHLLSVAFDVLKKNLNLLPIRCRGTLAANRFCAEIIGAGIQKNLPSRMQQLLKQGLCFILASDKMVARELDVEGQDFYFRGSKFKLGVDSCYDAEGLQSFSFSGTDLMGGYYRSLAETIYQREDDRFYTKSNSNSYDIYYNLLLQSLQQLHTLSNSCAITATVRPFSF